MRKTARNGGLEAGIFSEFGEWVTEWLGREGSNLRMAESKSAALPLGDAPTLRRAVIADFFSSATHAFQR